MISQFFSNDAGEQRRAMRLLRRYRKRVGKALKEKHRLAVRFRRALEKGNVYEMQSCYQELCGLQNHLDLYAALGSRDFDHGCANVFVISSLLLRASYALCTQQEEEGMHLVIGFSITDMIIASQILPIEYAHRSLSHAAADHQDTHQKFISTLEQGHQLVSLVHAHPGLSNRPSYDDMETQRKWEIGNTMISGIWNRDRCIRFFADSLPFVVEVVGNHVETIDENTFRLE